MTEKRNYELNIVPKITKHGIKTSDFVSFYQSFFISALKKFCGFEIDSLWVVIKHKVWDSFYESFRILWSFVGISRKRQRLFTVYDMIYRMYRIFSRIGIFCDFWCSNYGINIAIFPDVRKFIVVFDCWS